MLRPAACNSYLPGTCRGWAPNTATLNNLIAAFCTFAMRQRLAEAQTSAALRSVQHTNLHWRTDQASNFKGLILSGVQCCRCRLMTPVVHASKDFNSALILIRKVNVVSPWQMQIIYSA